MLKPNNEQCAAEHDGLHSLTTWQSQSFFDETGIVLCDSWRLDIDVHLRTSVHLWSRSLWYYWTYSQYEIKIEPVYFLNTHSWTVSNDLLVHHLGHLGYWIMLTNSLIAILYLDWLILVCFSLLFTIQWSPSGFFYIIYFCHSEIHHILKVNGL